MNITAVKVNKFESGKLRGFADVTFDDMLTIKGYKIFEGSKGLFVSTPSRQDKDGKYIDMVWVEDRDFMDEIQKTVLKEYESVPNTIATSKTTRANRPSVRVTSDPNDFGPAPA